MSEKSKSTPELLLDRQERILRLVVRAIVHGNPDVIHRTNEHRVANAVALLLGVQSARGAPGYWRDDMLEMMAFLYSVEQASGRSVSLQSLAENVIGMPGGPGRDPEGAIAKIWSANSPHIVMSFYRSTVFLVRRTSKASTNQ